MATQASQQQQGTIEIVNGEVEDLAPFVPDVYCLRLQCPESLKVTSTVVSDLLEALKGDEKLNLKNIQWTVAANVTHDDNGSRSDTQLARRSPAAQIQGSISNSHSNPTSDEVDTSLKIDSTTLPKYFCRTVPAEAPEGQKIVDPDSSLVEEETETILVEMWYKTKRPSDDDRPNEVAAGVRQLVMSALKVNGTNYQVYILKYSLGAAKMAPPAKNDMCTQTSSE